MYIKSYISLAHSRTAFLFLFLSIRSLLLLLISIIIIQKAGEQNRVPKYVP